MRLTNRTIINTITIRTIIKPSFTKGFIMKKTASKIATLFVIASSLLATQASAAPLKVATSFSILEDFVKNVGGSRIEIINIVPADGDTHTYQPTTEDVRKLSGTKLVFVNGLGLEGFLDKLIKTAADKAKVVTVSAGLKPRQLIEDGQTEDDPHMWWDLARSRTYVANIAKALIKADPAGKAAYTANAAKYTKTLNELEVYAKAQFSSIPKTNRKMVTNHDAFGYFAAYFRFTIVGAVIPSGSTESEPSAKALGELSKTIKREGVRAIFTENIVNSKLADAIAKESGAKVAPPLYSDALGTKGSSGETFVKAFRFNVDTIVAALK